MKKLYIFFSLIVSSKILIMNRKLFKKFEVNSAASKRQRFGFVRNEILSLYDELEKFSQEIVNILPSNKFLIMKEFTEESNQLAKLLDENGSDKASVHNYHSLYANLFDRHLVRNVLEIGIGTNNVKVPSNMGKSGKPGASLMAFSDFFENAWIYGLDIDPTSFTNTEMKQIKVFYLDQLNEDTFKEILEQKTKFDFIIDDGIHLPSANLRTLRKLQPLFHKETIYIVEDISDDHLFLWKIVQSIMNGNGYISEIIKFKKHSIFICQRHE
jgi:hypothetical protein